MARPLASTPPQRVVLGGGVGTSQAKEEENPKNPQLFSADSFK